MGAVKDDHADPGLSQAGILTVQSLCLCILNHKPVTTFLLALHDHTTAIA